MKKTAVVLLITFLISYAYAAETLERALSFGKNGVNDADLKTVADIEFANNLVYILDSGNYKVKVFDKNGAVIVSFGSFGSGRGELRSPSRVCADSDGNIYVLDYYSIDNDRERANGLTGQFSYPRVQKFSPLGKYLLSYGRAGAGEGEFLCSPSDIACDKDGNVVILDACASKVMVFDKTGKFVRAYGSFGDCSGCFKQPVKLDLDENGNVFVLDPGAGRIVKFDALGKNIDFNVPFGNEDGQINSQSYFKILKDGTFAVLQEMQSYTNKRWGLKQNSYYVKAGIKYFDKEGKFLKQTTAIASYDFEMPPFEYRLILRQFLGIGPENELYALQSRNNAVEKYVIKDSFMDGSRLNTRIYVESSMAGNDNRYYPVPGEPQHTLENIRTNSHTLGASMEYAVDERSNVNLDLNAAYGQNNRVYDAVSLPTPTGEKYESEAHSGTVRLGYNRIYDLNEQKRFNLSASYSFNNNMIWTDPLTVIYHNSNHTIYSIVDGSASVDIIPGLRLSGGGNYYLWADYYDDESYEHPRWSAYGRMEWGF